MAGYDQLFGKGANVAEQLLVWQVFAQLVSALGGPLFDELAQQLRSDAPITALSVADAVDSVIKSHLSFDQGAQEASYSGINRSRFQTLVDGAGEPPGVETLLSWWRRGIIDAAGRGADSTSVEQGVLESRVKNKWLPGLMQSAFLPIGVADAVDAVVEGQISHDQGANFARQNGIDGDMFQILVNTRGNPPSPSELNELHRRGLIPLTGTGPDATSVQQGIFEGATKDKWWSLLAALADYVPPPRTVTAMVREGALTDDEALVLFQKAGLSQQLAGQYLAAAHLQKTTAQRELSAQEIANLYRDGFIDAGTATAMLKLLRFSDQDAAFLLDLAAFQQQQQQIRTAVSRIQTLYVNHKIDAATAGTTLDQLGIPATSRDQMLTTWNLERAANVKLLTAAEIVDGVKAQIFDDVTGVQLLEDLGYLHQEAVWRLEIGLKQMVPGL